MSAPPAEEAAIWHDVECSAYAADLPAWRRLASAAQGPVLELGAGTGRVALDLERAGSEVVAVERDPDLAAALAERAGQTLEVVVADALALDLDRDFALVLAPMQLLQIIGGQAERARTLDAVARHLRTDGVVAAAIVESAPDGDVDAGDILPDVREVQGWVYSSLPVALRADAAAFEATRVRQRVSPRGELAEWTHVDRLERLSAEELDSEAARAGLVPRDRIAIPGDDAFVGSTICVWALA